ncbi:MAG: glycosyltransferase family 2 protein [candidate division KSB1 bacterium]|nr:glycosyltransferase family 2 protein [candidate division KSB1 bacterium]MDQ7062816.1 glycosyltransferase family 2 protein [candidate division KSB1 bacterium]
MKDTPPRQHRLSVTLIVQNEANNIRECLQSVAWADEIVVVDGGSTDNTVALAQEFTDRVLHHPWPGYAAQKQFALEQATCPWVLSIDADERVTPELRDEILGILSQEDIPFAGFRIPRLSTFLGKFMYHGGWYPGYQLRLFRRDRVRVTEARVHEGFEVDGAVGTLQHHFVHYTHRTLSESFERLNRYSSLEALDRAGGKRVRWYHILLHPIAAFFNKYIGLQGYRDGMHGFLLALVSAMVKMALYMKIWELQHRGEIESQYELPQMAQETERAE